MMKGVITKVQDDWLNLKRKNAIAGKTGTTNKDIDLTFVGYPHYVAGIWLGHDTPKVYTIKAIIIFYGEQLWKRSIKLTD